MKRILTYLIVFIFTVCAFSVNIKAEEIENVVESEPVVETITEEPKEEVVEEPKEEVVVEEPTEETTEPEHEKTLTENEDGTYTIGLTVKGETEEVINTKKVNVVITLDTSGSMNDGTGNILSVQYNATNARDGELYGLVNGEYVLLTKRGNNFYYNNNKYNGSRYTKTVVEETRLQAAQAAVNSLAESLLSNNGGNNPDDTIQISLVTFATHAEIGNKPTTSLNEFESVVNSLKANGGTNWEEALKKISTVNFNDEDETYVIFVSDGNPTFRSSSNGHYSDYDYQNGVYGDGQEGATNVQRSYDAAKDDAKAIVDSGAKFYTIGAYGNVDRMESLTTDAGAPKGNYYSAIDTLHLEEALNAILNEIKSAGIGTAKIIDGTTSHVVTSTGVSHLLTVDEESYKYYKDDEEWDSAPEANLNEDGEVVWDLGSGLLDNDVTYKVTFDAWASQEAMDLVADLKNGTVKYEDLDPEIQKYLTKNGDTYSLATNTVATLKYVDTRDVVPTKRGDNTQTVVYENPQPRAQDVPSMTVEKEWANDIDELSKSPIEIELLRDGELNATITLNNDNDYSEDVFIAPGRILVQGGSGKYKVKETGHDYTFRETGSDVHNWELSSEIFHPMFIADDIVMLVKRDSKPEGEEITNYFVINGNYYEISSINKLVATNERRSWVDITKTVSTTSTSIDENETFDFEISVTDPNGDDIEFIVTNNDTVVTEDDGLEVTGAVLNTTTGNYTTTSGSSFLVSIKAGWNIRIKNLLSNSTYTIEEVNIDSKYALDSIKLNGADLEVGAISGTVDSANNTYSYEFTNKVIATDIVVFIEWNDQDNLYNNRPNNVTLNLSDGNGVITQPAMEATRGLSWKYVYRNMPLTDEDGNAIEYTLTQNTVNGYKAADVAKEGNVFTVTNEHDLITVTVKKVWSDEDDYEGFRPDSLTVTLSNNQSVVLSARTNWEGSIEELPTYIDGNKVEYTWTEEDVDGYTLTNSSTVNNVTTLTNTHEVSEASVSVTKVWDDSDNAEGFRPDSVTVNLLANNNVIDTVTLSDDNDWSYEWTKLDAYADGEEIVYSITEDSVADYTTIIVKEQGSNTFTVTNSREVEYIDLTVRKIWDDSENAEGFRPNNLTVTLSTGDEVVLNSDNEWEGTIEGLQKYVNGEEVEYTWTEEGVEGYELTNVEVIDGVITVLTNSREVEYIDLAVIKIWDDSDNVEGFRPNNLTVTLSNGDEVVLNSDNEWTATIEGLQKYVDGKEVEYTWVEEDVEGYELTNTEVVDGTITVLTNTREVSTIDINVLKYWGVPDEVLSSMPTVTIILTLGDTEVATATLSNDNNWTYTFEGMAKYADKEELVYGVKEVEIEGYKPEISGNQEDGFVVKNIPTGQGGVDKDPEEPIEDPIEEPIEEPVIDPVDEDEILPPHTGIEESNNSIIFIELLIALILISLSIKRKINE